MDQSPTSKAKSNSASQNIPNLLQKPKVHYHVYNTLPLVPMLSQIYSIHILITYFFIIYFNIILPSLHGFLMWMHMVTQWNGLYLLMLVYILTEPKKTSSEYLITWNLSLYSFIHSFILSQEILNESLLNQWDVPPAGSASRAAVMKVIHLWISN